MTHSRGYTLVELIVAVGLFASIMVLASGSYIMMIGLNQQAQGLATGINSLSFTLDTMTRDIQTGSAYNCGSPVGGDCPSGDSSFYFVNKNGQNVAYTVVSNAIMTNGSVVTDPSVLIDSLVFVVSGAGSYASGNDLQPTVRIIVAGRVLYGHGKSQSFAVQTAATMRGADI